MKKKILANLMVCLMLATIFVTCVSAKTGNVAQINDSESTFKKVIIGKLIGSYFVSGGQFSFEVKIKCWDKEFSAKTSPGGFFMLTIEMPKRNVHSYWLEVTSLHNDYGAYINRPIEILQTSGVKLLLPVLSGL